MTTIDQGKDRLCDETWDDLAVEYCSPSEPLKAFDLDVVILVVEGSLQGFVNFRSGLQRLSPEGVWSGCNEPGCLCLRVWSAPKFQTSWVVDDKSLDMSAGVELSSTRSIWLSVQIIQR